MSTLRNAVKRKTHKERSQPLARRRFGLLEKKKDYQKRAVDFHRKERTIKVLQRKADERNEDEFYFAMQNQRTKDGVHQAKSTKANKYSQEELQLMKTQDVGYVSLKAQTEGKKVARLKETLHFATGRQPYQQQHTLFREEDYDEASSNELARADSFNSYQDREDQAQEPEAATKWKRQQLHMYKQLEERTERHAKLSMLAADMRIQRQLMGKGRHRKLKSRQPGGDSGKPVFQWHKVRQR